MEDHHIKRILVVDDDSIFRHRLAKALEGRGYEVQSAEDAISAISSARLFDPQAAVIDLRIDKDDGLELSRSLLAHHPDIRIVILTGYGSIANALEAIRMGVVDYLPKPADTDQILAALTGESITNDRGKPVASDSTPSLDRVEWEHIQRVLADCGGNITRAAEILGIHRRSLQRKLAKFPPPK